VYTKIVQSGNTFEIYRYEKEPPIPNRKGTQRPRDRQRRTNRRTGLNIERTRKNFIRIVRSNLTGTECPSLITLTMRNIVSIRLAYSCLHSFNLRLRKQFGEGFRYVAVPEFQKRGAVHFHILYWGLADEIIQNERSNRTIQNLWALGYVDCLPTDGSGKLAGYLAKYMSKSMQDDRLAGQKAYSCSRNIMRPMSYSDSTGLMLPDSFWEGGEIRLTQRTFQTQWMGSCNYQLIVKTDHERESESSLPPPWSQGG